MMVDDPKIRADALNHVDLEHWTPPQHGTFPCIRLGQRWFNLFWFAGLLVILLVIAIAVCKELILLEWVRAFIHRFPGTPSTAFPVTSGFPLWLRAEHFLNLFFMMFIIRSGIQILADHPRLYWNRDSTPGTEWFRFQHEVPKNRVWTAKEDSVSLPQSIGLPGLRHSIGLARWWHFSFDLFWLLNGAVFYVLLFSTDQWLRIVPTTWEVFPNALSTLIQYLALDFPKNEGWYRYNSLQQIAYFITVFIAAPGAVVSGLMQAPAISNKLGWFGRLFNRQRARTIHFAVLCWFISFVFIHVTMVTTTGVLENLNHMFAGEDSRSLNGTWAALMALGVVALAWFWASPFTIRQARLVQHIGSFLIGWIKALGEMWDVKTQYSDEDISPFLWVNGKLPTSEHFTNLQKNHFNDYVLRIGGLVENPQEISYADLKALPKHEQTTCHFCIQGWSGVAKWGGVRMSTILNLVKPKKSAKYAVFYSFDEGADGGQYYDVHNIENMNHELTMLAYEMNGQALSVLYGAPLRLRCENEIGFKQVKWIKAIDFVESFQHIGAGQGGYNEDHEFFGRRMPI